MMNVCDKDAEIDKSDNNMIVTVDTVFDETLFGFQVPYGLEKDLSAYVLSLLSPSALHQ